MGAKDEKYLPVKRYAFPAGDCGGEIRVTIPVFASADDMRTFAKCMMTVAENWRDDESV